MTDTQFVALFALLAVLALVAGVTAQILLYPVAGAGAGLLAVSLFGNRRG